MLRSIQCRALQAGALQGKNLLICSPSGSGKTLVGELVCLHQALAGQKALLLVPLRALANEKYLQFKTKYQHLPLKIDISTGDYSAEHSDLENADIGILTYERFDWLLRTNPSWLDQLGAIIIDEVHNLGSAHRGPRLESAIVRLRQRLPKVQVVALSATIANPKELADWLGCYLIHSEERPVELRYRILLTSNHARTIAKLVRATIRREGQALVFAPSRREAERLSLALTSVIRPLLSSDDSQKLEEFSALVDLKNELLPIRERLSALIRYGVAFHHAGLDTLSRRIVEDLFQRRLLKVICCTTTLGAGINTPARLVILMQPFFINQTETGSAEYSFIDANRVHQILGRAGRPGHEDLGFAIILASTTEELERIDERYFLVMDEKIVPKYDRVESQLYAPPLLREQVLVLAACQKGASAKEIRAFFEKTHWWFQQSRLRSNQTLEQLIHIGSIDVDNLISRMPSKEQSSEDESNAVQSSMVQKNSPLVEILILNSDKIEARVKHRGWHNCSFTGAGPVCSCQNHSVAGQLCPHLVILARYTLQHHPQYAREIIPRSLKEEFILDFLERHGFIVQREERFFATSFGKLVVKLYIRPSTAIWIRGCIPSITTTPSFIEAIIQAMRFEGNQKPIPGLAKSLRYLVDKPEMPLSAASRVGNVEIGDLESLMSTAVWLGNAIISLARQIGFEEVAVLGELVVETWEAQAG